MGMQAKSKTKISCFKLPTETKCILVVLDPESIQTYTRILSIFEFLCTELIQSSLPPTIPGDCNAASFYVDPNGFPQCFLLNCNPFSDCQWTLSASSDAVGAYMKVSMSDNPSELQTVALAVEEELRWNIFYPTTSGNRLNVTDATTITMESTTTTTPAPITQKPTTPELTTQVEVANIEVTTTPKPATTTEKVLTTEAAATNGKVEWPELPSSTADAGMGNQDVGDAADLVKGTDEPAEGSHKSFGAENQKKGVNVAAVVICSIGGIALFIAGVVIAFKRYQIDKDRSVYRPLMDDINTRAFKESDPLH